jgi:structural maintenance of chromosome 4
MNEMEQIQTSLNNTKAIEATFGVKIKAYVEKEEKLLKIVETQINIYNKIIDEASCSLICNGFEPEQVHDIILNTKTFGEKYLISSRRLKISITNFQQKSSKNQFSKNTDSRLEIQPLEKINNYLEPIENEISKLKTVLKDKANNTINMDDLNDYKRKRVEHDEKTKELRESLAKKDCLRIEWESLQSKRLDEFLTEFDKICCNLKEIYQMVTLGGDAELELVDSLDPFSKGISISVRPPNKSWKVITNLSGGEKTISSLSLVLALHKYKPSTFYVMDEIDAALDFKNVSILGHYLKDWTHDTQFIIVSLRNNLFELADRLVGLYQTNNYTQSILINPVFIGIK